MSERDTEFYLRSYKKGGEEKETLFLRQTIAPGCTNNRPAKDADKDTYPLAYRKFLNEQPEQKKSWLGRLFK